MKEIGTKGGQDFGFEFNLAAVKCSCDLLADKGRKVPLQDHNRDFSCLAVVSGQALCWSNQQRVIAVFCLFWSVRAGSVCGRVFFKQKG